MADFNSVIEEVRSRNDILDVIGGYVHLQKKGSAYFGLCPFHNEKTPSFSVTPSKQMYYCFGCQKGGNVFTFMQEYENMTFREALQALADRAGVELPENAYSAESKSRDDVRRKLLEVNRAAAIYYAYQLKSPQGINGRDYFRQRQLSDETILRFGLGYAGVTRDGLVRHLRSKGYDDRLITDAGLANFDERDGLHDRFWNRVMYPIQDGGGRVIGFGGRVLGEGEPKYLNTRETLVFDKGRNLYGLNLARSTRKDYFILCEGYMDVIAMHQAGFGNAVAGLGTAFTSGQATLVHRYVRKVLLAYDSDGAGTGAALKAISILRDMDMTVRVINMLPYKDPDEFIKNLGREEFEKRIEDAEDGFFFEIRMMERDYDIKDPGSRSDFTHALAGRLLVFEDEVRRENYLTAMAERYSIPREQLANAVRKKAETGEYRPRENPRSGMRNGSNDDPVLRNQRNLITWLADEPAIFDTVRKYVEPDDFSDPIYREVVTQMYKDMEGGRLNPAAIISTFTDQEDQSKAASLFNTVLVIDDDADMGMALHDLIYMVKKAAVEDRNNSDVIDEESIRRNINDKRALEELRRATIKI